MFFLSAIKTHLRARQRNNPPTLIVVHCTQQQCCSNAAFLLSSATSPSSLLHPTSGQWDHARGQRQHHLRGSGVTHALCEMDAGSWRPHAWRWHANRPQRSGADGHTTVQQLHLCGHVNAWCDRGSGTDYCERWVHPHQEAHRRYTEKRGEERTEKWILFPFEDDYYNHLF